MTLEAPPTSPYVGLSPYSTNDAILFYGRDRELRTIVDSLDASPLTLLFGPSGVGKSSLLRAGVVTALRQRDHSFGGQVVIIYSTWRGGSIGGLEQEIAAQADIELRAGATLADILAAAGARAGDVYLILDELEDYFRYHRGEDTLGAELAIALARRELRLRLLLSIRDDALSSVARWAPRLPGLFQGLLRIDPLDPSSARKAILGPLQGTGFQIEDPLVEELIRQVAHARLSDEDIQIEAPYLQIVLARLWEEETAAGSMALRAATLHRLGGADEIVRSGVTGALGQLSRKERRAAASIFGSLVTPSGQKIALTVQDLAAYTELSEAEVRALAERLGKPSARILRFVGPETVEIYHDVLVAPILHWQKSQ